MRASARAANPKIRVPSLSSRVRGPTRCRFRRGAVQARVCGLRPRSGRGGLRGGRFHDAGAAAGAPE
eukprot:2118218-Alexandrium_andersonii.AAC.1